MKTKNYKIDTLFETKIPKIPGTPPPKRGDLIPISKIVFDSLGKQ